MSRSVVIRQGKRHTHFISSRLSDQNKSLSVLSRFCFLIPDPGSKAVS